MNLIFLDTESTGTEKEDRLIQLAYEADFEGGGNPNELFKPPVPIKIEAMAVHHITERMVADKPTFVGSGAQELLRKLIEDGGVVVAHNAKFDIAMLEKEGITVPKHICTLKVARALDKAGKIESYSLQYLRYFLGLEVEADAHDAYGDILVLKKLFERLAAKMVEKNGHNQVAAFEQMIEISSKPSLIPRCHLKKHKGKLWSDVAKVDADYLRWFLGEKEKESPIDEDMIYTLKYHLKI